MTAVPQDNSGTSAAMKASDGLAVCLRWSLIDIGLNLTDKMYQGVYNGRHHHKPDVGAVLDRGYRCGVRGVVLTGGNLKESQRVIDMCARYNQEAEMGSAGVDGRPRCRFLCTVGCHPTRCGEFTEDPESYYNNLDRLITEHSVRSTEGTSEKCVAAVGEIGLDYDRLFFCPKETQLQFFRKQLALAEKHHLPLFLHDRNTGGDFYDIIAEYKGRFPGGVVHSFTGTQEELQRYLDLGLYIGVNGCSLKTPENLAVVRTIPLDRVLIETDGPWCGLKNSHASRSALNERAGRLGLPGGKCESDALLASYPVVRKEKHKDGAIVKDRCEPCHLVHVLEVLHELHKDSATGTAADGSPLTIEALASIIEKNTQQVFPF